MKILFFGLLGLIIGSFLNAVIYRLENIKTLILGRSICPLCKHLLSAIDLVPLFSFIFLRRKCRYCHEYISWQYFLVEASTAILFILAFLKYGLVWQLSIALILISLMIVIFVYDLKYQLVLDKVSLPAVVLAVVLSYFSGMPVGELLLGALVGGGFFLIQIIISKGRWVGGGDIRLGLLMGALLGWPLVLVGLFATYIVGAIIALILLTFKLLEIKGRIALGPFLIVGIIFSWFWGQQFLNWYLSLL